MLVITDDITLRDDELEWQAIRAQGAGGQNVNKVSSALHLRFDIHRSSLPHAVKQRLLANRDQRIAADGTLVIKAAIPHPGKEPRRRNRTPARDHRRGDTRTEKTPPDQAHARVAEAPPRQQDQTRADQTPAPNTRRLSPLRASVATRRSG